MARSGRKRKAGPREPNGRLVRSYIIRETERKARETMVTARQRQYGLTEKMAEDSYAGSALGRMLLWGHITKEQYDAGHRYLECRNAYQRAIGAVPDYDEPRPEESSLSTYEEFCQRARSVWADIQSVLRDLMVETRSPAPVSALDVIVVRDIHCETMSGDLKIALNALHRHFFGNYILYPLDGD